MGGRGSFGPPKNTQTPSVPVVATRATQETDPYVMLNAGQLANRAAGRQVNDYGPRPFTFDDLLDNMAARLATTNSGYSGPSVADLTNEINQSFDRRVGTLAQNKAQAVSAIQNIAQQYAAGLQQNQMSYQQGADAINAEISRRAADMAQRTSGTAQQLATSATLEGGNAEAVRAQAANIASAQEQANQFQRDLVARAAQIAAENYRNAQNAGQLVQQSAMGGLESGYAQLLNALEAAREQQIMGLTASRASGGGGGEAPSASDALDLANKYLRGLESFRDLNSNGLDFTNLTALMGAAAEDDPAGLAAFILSLPEEQRQNLGFRFK